MMQGIYDTVLYLVLFYLATKKNIGKTLTIFLNVNLDKHFHREFNFTTERAPYTKENNGYKRRVAVKLIEIIAQHNEKAPRTEERRIDALSIDKGDIQIIKFHQRNQQHIVENNFYESF